MVVSILLYIGITAKPLWTDFVVSKLFKKGSINFLAKWSGLQFFKKVSFIQFTFITLSQVLFTGNRGEKNCFKQCSFKAA